MNYSASISPSREIKASQCSETDEAFGEGGLSFFLPSVDILSGIGRTISDKATVT